MARRRTAEDAFEIKLSDESGENAAVSEVEVEEPSTKMKQVTITMREISYNEVKKAAIDRGMKMKELTTQIFDEWLANNS